MADSEPRPVRRYIMLIKELLAERLGEHGGQSDVARSIGLSRSYLTRFKKGERVSVGIEKINDAIQGLRLDPRYFFGAKEPRTYRDYLTHEPPFAAWRDFLGTEYGRSMVAHERQALESLDLASWEPTTAFYTHVLLALRGLPPDDVAQTLALNAAVAKAHRKAKPDSDKPEG